MTCLTCDKPTKRFGKDRKGNQRYRCLFCGKTFIEPKVKMLDSMILAEGKALAVLSHLIEGCICGARVAKALSQRWHECSACGLSAARDHVSAQVILARGLRVQALTSPVAECVA